MEKLSYIAIIILGILLIYSQFFSLSSDEKKALETYRAAKEDYADPQGPLKNENIEIDFNSNRIIRNISKTWKYEDAKKHFSVEVLENIDENQFVRLFEAYSQLGPFREQLGSHTISTASKRPGSTIYSSRFSFENGEAIVTLMIKKNDGDWFIETISITSDIF